MIPTWTRYLPRFILKRIEDRHELLEVLDNSGWMMGDKVLRQLVGLIVGVWLARYLGPQLFGDYSYAIAMVMIVTPMATLALDGIAIRNMVQDSSSREKILGTSFILMLGGGILAFSLAVAAIFWARPDDQLVQWLVGIMAAGTIVQAFIAIEFWFESQMQWKFTVYAKTSAFLLLSLVKISLILLQAPLIAFAWASLADTALGSIGLLSVYRQQGFPIRAWRFSRSVAKSLLQDSWPLFLSTLLTMIYLRIDQIMIGNMIGSRELGNYSVAVRISEVWYFIPIVINSSVFPAVVRAEATSEELYYAHLQRLYNLMAFMSYTVAVPVAFFAKDIIQLLFSSAYADAGPLLAILIWTGLFTSLGAARNVFIVSKNWTKVHLISIALGCGLNIFLNIILIPEYGAMGAVAATFISYWFAVHGTCFFFTSLRETGLMMTKAMLYPKFW
ncbi:MAG: flippase [Deltaproteobacteria bacterium]|jgi:O-antigen/teichoic acid export membrane protein|nr:flippase [Deltaproteobacteria bacterium]